MSKPVDARLQRLLGGDHLAELRRRLRRSFAYAPADRPPAQIRLDGLTFEQHAALASLQGRPQRFSASMRLDLDLVDTAFRDAGIASSLRDALEQLDGPIPDKVAMRLRLHDQWTQVVETCRNPHLSALLRDRAGLGLLRRLSQRDATKASVLCRATEAVLDRLPAGAVPRSQLAAGTLGDAHALDDGQPVATLVLAARRRRVPLAPQDEAETNPQPAAERTRDLWAAAGVLVNELARPALFLNLPIMGVDARGSGEPGYISLRALLRAPPPWDVGGRDIHVCENPNLVAIAADRLGPLCRPLVCTDGMPAAAQRTLLHQLARAGGRLRYHGDFDWPGLRIANHMIREHGAMPWRLDVGNYLAAVRAAPPGTRHLDGAAVIAPWDPALTEAMARRGLAVAEEAVADDLLEDLAAAGAPDGDPDERSVGRLGN